MTDLPQAAVDVYAVGLARDLRTFRAQEFRRWRTLLRRLAYVPRMARERNWRAVKNYFNGYLAEPREWPSGLKRCGSGWTRSRALRDYERRLSRVATPEGDTDHD